MSTKRLSKVVDNVWIKVLKIINTIPLSFHLTVFLIIIVIPHKENIGGLLGGLAICIILHAFVLGMVSEINKLLQHRKKFMFILGYSVSIILFLTGLLYTPNTYADIIGGAKEQKGILYSAIDGGKYIKSRTSHNIRIKVSTFKSDFTMLNSMDYYNKLLQLEGKEVTVVFYPNSNSFIRIKEINDK